MLSKELLLVDKHQTHCFSSFSCPSFLNWLDIIERSFWQIEVIGRVLSKEDFPVFAK